MQEVISGMSIAEIAASFMALNLLLIVGFVVRQQVLIKRCALDVSDLSRQLGLFTDTSINVARCVDKLVNERAQALQNGIGTGIDSGKRSLTQQASRRWLLNEAKTRLGQGHELREIERPLGLSSDEVRLLRVFAGNQTDTFQHRH